MADYKGRIGNLIRDARKHRGLTQQQLADLLGTSQSAVNRIEKGHQNLSLEMLARIRAALDSELVSLCAVGFNGGVGPRKPIVLTERGDTVTENALMAAALHPGTTVIRNASSNYMVQDLCFYLQKLGVEVEGIGTTTLRVTGREVIDVDVDYAPSEDPIEAMSLLAAAIVTRSSITIRRVPIEFLEIELATLGEMGFQHSRSEEYV